LAALGQLIGAAALEALSRLRRSPRGRKPQLPGATFLQALLFHFLFPTGTFAEHLRQLTGRKHSEGALSERRQALSWGLFVAWLQEALRPMAQPERNPTAFWRGWRLLAWDGTQFSLTNTPQVRTKTHKARSRRQPAAWAKITAAVLLELGLHNPLAAAIGYQGESEYALTQRLLKALPARSLLLADRLTGCPAMLYAVYGQLLALGSHFLVRVRKNLTVLNRRPLADGSALIEVAVGHRRSQRQVLATFTLREIRVRAFRPGFRDETLRLWTSLVDPATAPALELVKLYTRRWEQELYFRQLKLELRTSEVLRSHIPETGAQEVAMLILATALLAQERARAAAGQLPALEVSFLKCADLLRPLWLILAVAGHVLTAAQRKALVAAVYREIQACRKAKRRNRSCQRAVRQPIKGWPRLLRPRYANGPWKYSLLRQATNGTPKKSR
jgi:hypothetical protein